MVNCLWAILRREDHFDTESRNRMLLANASGALIGAGLALYAIWAYFGESWGYFI